LSSKKRFKQSIKCGTGEAYFILRDNPAIDFSKDITKAALSILAYDGQCEGHRAEYIAGLISLTDTKENIIDTIIKALAGEENIWALDQLFELAVIYAKQGNNKAKQAIYKRYHRKTILSSEWCGQNAIIKLDGMEGLKVIAAKRGQALLQDSEDWEDSWFVDDFQKENPTINVYAELESASKENPSIKKYLDVIRQHKFTQESRCQRPKYDYQVVKGNIEAKRMIPAPPAAIRELSESDIKKLADDFLQEIDPDKQERYLRVFARIQYPYDYHPILQIARKPNSRKNRLVEFACKTLQYFSAPDIRQFAIDKLNRTNAPADYLYLLVSNYEEGDYKLLSRIASTYKNEDVIHSLIWGYVAIYKANKTEECQEPLEILYEKLNCALHRIQLIETLHANNALSERIVKEIEFDSYEATRELFQKIRNG
jgi:hypothetical protein